MATSTDQTIETWSTVPGLPSEYEVSTLGRVRITVTRLPRKAGDCLNARMSKAGLRVEISIDKKQRGFLIKTLVMRTFVPGFVERDEIFYRDSDPNNCTLDNLTTEPPRVPLPDPIADDEEWKPVADPTYSDRYLVSNYGRVCPTRWSKIRPRGGAAVPIPGPHGYPQVTLSKGAADSGKTFLVHRLVAFAFLGRPPQPGMVVDHIDRDHANGKLSNLRWVTYKENHPLNDDRFQDFKCLSPDAANEIRRRYNTGEKQVDIAKDYGVSQNQVSMCVLNKVWKRKNNVPIDKAPPFVLTDPGPLVWKPCPSYPRFEASNRGDVRYSAGTPLAGRVLPQDLDVGGYPRIQSQINNVRIIKSVHRLVADAFFGPANGRHVNHKNMDRLCAWVTNLEYVTPTGNMRHRRGYKYTTAD